MGRRRLLAFGAPSAVCVLVALALAACSPPSAGPTTTTVTTTSTTTTTTTQPVGVLGTEFVRARVAPLKPGALVLAPVSEGSAAWSKMVPIAYRSFGSGPDLLLISGQDGTLSWWGQSLLSDLSGHYRVTVFDLPGVGYSGVATSRVTLAWLADMVAGFSLTVGLEDPVVLGWGLGGQIALSLVERHPGLASALVLVDTAAGGADADLPSRGVVRLLSEPAATPLTLSTVLFPPTVAGLAERLSWPDSLFEGPPDWMTAQSVEAEASLQATIWRTASLRAELARMTTPALVVCGADDVVFPPLNSSRLASEIPHATLVSFPGSGYGAIIEDEPEFVAALERFTLANVSPTTSTTTTSTSPSS